MTREQTYKAQLIDLGIYHPSFEPEIHTLAMMEREHQRTLKRWKAAEATEDSELYPVIVQQRRDILAHRDALGLTPKGLRRLKAASLVPEPTTAADAMGGSPAVASLVDLLREKAQAAAAVSNLDRADA